MLIKYLPNYKRAAIMRKLSMPFPLENGQVSNVVLENKAGKGA